MEISLMGQPSCGTMRDCVMAPMFRIWGRIRDEEDKSLRGTHGFGLRS
jgi:hypothetical protein